MATLKDTLTPKRTPLYHLHQADASRAEGWQALNGYAIDGGDNTSLDADFTSAAHCALVDVSALARLGVRGSHAASFLDEHGYQLPDVPNQATRQPDGSLVARLSASEYLLLGSLNAQEQRISQQEATWPPAQAGVYLLPRQDTHAWLALTGTHASNVMAKLCGVDLSPAAFAPGQVAQTSVARANAIVINASQTELTCLYLLVDSASASYFWPVLLDAMQEFGGKPLSIKAFMNKVS
ncbi:MAG TPA: sarcosine oxidase [Halomonas sp.]|jgi:sarcosine oxidase subunit gamma|uniref:hypothetical protein n=1 Tax=Halomonadaceae TaxID=28256 RepID=UPI0009BD8AA9|nr:MULTISPECIES: hypothetical protein [Halomonas]MAG53094.1 sarcosine oxidase [Halomonas sp.]MCO7243959.1 hypothetical protein [Halomonas sp. Ps84H-12]PHR01228.1 MAG: sarcosine oxidase [Halomonas sp.]HAV44163.1 sarcosine oxidase [Halomonas sp.]HBM42730.1 sarcosine oxidase [Halomonas sp.]|tara:strand:- start:2514 stop:3227 length:714 start_codon:yes stop_codon:yes gene_type:complete